MSSPDAPPKKGTQSLQSPNPLKRGPHILIVGCGDVGRRLGMRLNQRFLVSGTTRTAAGRQALLAAGIRPVLLDLDGAHRPAIDLTHRWVVHLAPPQPDGVIDLRTRRLMQCLTRVERLVYVSTSGVYGDCQGLLIDETRKIAPLNARAMRRSDAETLLRQSAIARHFRLSVLRVPGIYSNERLPIERLKAGTPALQSQDDVYSNHIHADDLAQALEAALLRGRAQRIYHASDDEPLPMGEYFDQVADKFGLPRPPRLPRDQLLAALSPMQRSFMQESRRLSNFRLTAELGVRLGYSSVADALSQLP
jgi:nucleoside-diphosphate-sugar epimerase